MPGRKAPPRVPGRQKVPRIRRAEAGKILERCEGLFSQCLRIVEQPPTAWLCITVEPVG
jgi:hypothetical protein